MADLIAAVSTGHERAAIAILRLSGDGAAEAAARVFRPRKGSLADAAPGRMTLGALLDQEGRPIDHCLCVLHRAPRSYTGEDTAELHCHGSPAVLAEGLAALYAAGARPAEPGEFTKRAFLNGKLGLTEAEAVMDVIDADNAVALRNAAGQLGGALRRRADGVYDALVDIAAHFHAVIDWPDEDLEPFELTAYGATLARAEQSLTALLATAERGRLIKDGVLCAIIGRPNVGKSSLLNALLGYDRAIVTATAGTTRDTLEERAVIGGAVLRLTDTAGLRDTADTIEKLGVARAEQAAAEAAVLIAVFDGAAPLTADDETVLTKLAAADRGVAVLNKSDLPPLADASRLEKTGRPVVRLSAATGEGLDRLAAALETLYPACAAPEGEILTNARQAGEVLRARDALRAAREAMEAGFTPDAVLADVESAMEALAAMTGRAVRDDTVSRIFSRFCVGK